MIPTTLILTQDEIARLTTMPMALRVVAEAVKAQARGQAVMPPKIYLPLPHESDFRAMPAYLRRPAICGMKWVNVHPHNRRRGLPTVMATVILNDPHTGVPLAVLDGMLITRLRTGAAGGVAAKALARRNSRVVGLIGCGAQALSQLLALVELFRLERVNVWGYRAGEAARFCLQARRHLSVRCRPASTVEACVREADIIVTVTPSRRPLVKRRWVRPGTHVNAIGADAPGKQELDPAILRDAIVVVDDRTQAMHGGELNVPIAKGLFDPRRIHAMLGEVLIGRAPGRRSQDEITVFDSTGIAVHDIALGYEVYRQAIRRRLGQPIRFFERP